ncbi:hypothetical protein RJ639_042213, partial [Escallonia herrerae]
YLLLGALLCAACVKKMVDLQPVCCMCGDVGFPDKLFHCIKCRNRFQHSYAPSPSSSIPPNLHLHMYCSNYYSDSSVTIELCDWCQCEERSSAKQVGSSKKSDTGVITTNRSEYTGDKIKQHDREESTEKGKQPSTTGAPSPRTTTRRYKLLKDVMC